MDIRHITPVYAVSPQIDVAYIAAVAAAEAAGITFAVNPVTHQGLNMGMVDSQMAAADASSGPVLAYCASGTRSSIVWSLGQAGKMPTDAIIQATAQAGYDLGGMRGQLDMLAKG